MFEIFAKLGIPDGVREDETVKVNISEVSNDFLDRTRRLESWFESLGQVLKNAVIFFFNTNDLVVNIVPKLINEV